MATKTNLQQALENVTEEQRKAIAAKLPRTRRYQNEEMTGTDLQKSFARHNDANKAYFGLQGSRKVAALKVAAIKRATKIAEFESGVSKAKFFTRLRRAAAAQSNVRNDAAVSKKKAQPAAKNGAGKKSISRRTY